MTASVLVLCTGNVARSVMAHCMLEWLAEAEGVPLRVTTAGTHAVEGQPAGARTQAALRTVGALDEVSVGAHRSHQLAGDNVVRADLVVGMEAAHVRYVRRHHPEAAARTATLRHLCVALEPGPPRLPARVRALGLASLAADDDAGDVADPAGGDAARYAACAADLWALCQELVVRI